MLKSSTMNWKGMKFPSRMKLEGHMRKKRCGMKCTDPLGLKAFKAGTSVKKLKKVI